MSSEAGPPAAWLILQSALVPSAGYALDVACGRGRHALWLARRGLDVLALDRDAAAIAAVNDASSRFGLRVRAEVRDLESEDPALGLDRFAVIVAVHYLHRPLFTHLKAALQPGGVLVYETFTREQRLRGKPTNPDYLLEPGELLRLVEPLEVLAHREGDFEGRFVASVVARRRMTN